MGDQVLYVGRADFIKFDIIHVDSLTKTAGAIRICPRCSVRTLSGETLTFNFLA